MGRCGEFGRVRWDGKESGEREKWRGGSGMIDVWFVATVMNPPKD